MTYGKVAPRVSATNEIKENVKAVLEATEPMTIE